MINFHELRLGKPHYKKIVSIFCIIAVMLTFSITAYAEEAYSMGLTNEEGKMLDDMILRGQIWGYIKTTSGTITIPTSARVPGTSSYYIRLLQCSLNAIGYNCGTPDGVYGTNTKIGIMDFQRKWGLGVDGIAGEETWFNISGVIYDRGLTVPF